MHSTARHCAAEHSTAEHGAAMSREQSTPPPLTTVPLRWTAQWQSTTSWLVHAALHSPDQRSTLAQGGMLALGGVHAQIGMPTNSACGAHAIGDGAMHPNECWRAHS